jgi:hypothetical protein
MIGTRADRHGMKRGAASESSNTQVRPISSNLGCERRGLRRWERARGSRGQGAVG